MKLMLDGRPRKGAWIEILSFSLGEPVSQVAPARGRGLKYGLVRGHLVDGWSPPQGGVD